MHASVRAFLDGIVDYAGMFPPAKLPLETALANYVRYQAEPEAWMLGKFVCPATKLKELLPLSQPLAISCLGRGGNEAGEFLAGLRADLELVAAITQESRAEVNAYETRLPVQALKEPATVPDLLREATEILDACRLTGYFEIPLDANWRHSLRAIGTALASLNVTRHDRSHGIKIRCGGLEARDFPAPEQLAGVIHLCREHGVPFKATAGLHHPLRRHDPGFGVAMHGFLNVFGAAVLAFANKLSEEAIQAIITDEDAEHFRFNADGCRYLDNLASVAQIRDARRTFAVSFGSCSFDEPRDDLRRLGVLP